MKKMFLAGLCLTLSSMAYSRNYDGCYQLATKGVMYPVLCLSGTAEEGIGGGNARLALFGTNTHILKECLKSSSISITQSTFEFIVNGKKELVLSNFSADGIDGDATIGSTKLKFFRFSKSTSQTYIDVAYREHCL